MIDRVTTFEELFKLLYLFRRVICYVKIEVMTMTTSMLNLQKKLGYLTNKSCKGNLIKHGIYVRCAIYYVN